MMPGKLFHKIFPRWISATHCSINRLAYSALPPSIRNAHFPDWNAINIHEGLNGVDGLWLTHQQLPSRSVYNIDTHEGHGIDEAVLQYEQLIEAWHDNDTDHIAQQLAYTSHIITDICTPAHQHGKMIPPTLKSWYVWWTRDDWEEETSGKNHVLFELRMMYHIAFSQIGNIRVNVRTLRNILEAKSPAKTIPDILRRELERIRAFNIYREYVDKGWSDNLTKTVSRKIVPNIASTVSTLWLGAWMASRPKKLRRLPLIHNFSRKG